MWNELTWGSKWEGLISCQSGYLYETIRWRSLNIGKGAQWLSGRVCDLRLRGCVFEYHQHHCVVVLEQDTFLA